VAPGFPLLMTTLAERNLNKYGFTDRKWKSPYAHFTVMVDGHLHMVSTELGIYAGIEDVILDMLDAVSDCNETKIPFRGGFLGKSHEMNKWEKPIVDEVLEQMNRNFDEMHLDNVYNQMGYKQWGGHVPAGVVMPTADGDGWEMIVVPAKDPKRLATVFQDPLTAEDFMPHMVRVDPAAMAEMPLPGQVDVFKDEVLGWKSKQEGAAMQWPRK
jgi:hypothetical protein